MTKTILNECKLIAKESNFKFTTIKEFKDKIDWDYISSHQKLSEKFIKEFQDKVNWYCIYSYQNLSENFIKEFQDKVNWDYMSIYQKLSEKFIKEFQDKVDWNYISKYQNLSEKFIKEFKDKVDLNYISEYQKLSKKVRDDLNIKIDEDNWLYKGSKFKLKKVKESNLFEIIDDKYIIAYKTIRKDYYSVFNFQYKYLIGKKYKSQCDCTDNENSFGLSAWTKEKALSYYNKGRLIKVKIPINKLGRLTSEGKLRCFEFTIIEEVNK